MTSRQISGSFPACVRGYGSDRRRPMVADRKFHWQDHPVLRGLVPLLAFALLAGCASPGGAGRSAAHTDPARISRTLRGFVDNGSLVGVSALVTINGKEAYFGAFGMPTGKPAGP